MRNYLLLITFVLMYLTIRPCTGNKFMQYDVMLNACLRELSTTQEELSRFAQFGHENGCLYACLLKDLFVGDKLDTQKSVNRAVSMITDENPGNRTQAFLDELEVKKGDVTACVEHANKVRGNRCDVAGEMLFCWSLRM